MENEKKSVADILKSEKPNLPLTSNTTILFLDLVTYNKVYLSDSGHLKCCILENIKKR